MKTRFGGNLLATLTQILAVIKQSSKSDILARFGALLTEGDVETALEALRQKEFVEMLEDDGVYKYRYIP